MARAILLEIGVGDAQECRRESVHAGEELALELEEAELGRVLVADAPREEGLVRDREGEVVKRLSPLDPKGVLASRCLGRKSDVLDV
jgi:hypothetical protein